MDRIEELLGRYPALAPAAGDIRRAGEALCRCVLAGGKVLTCGNGGSAADAEHVVGELMKEFLRRRPIGEEARQRLTAADPSPADLIAGLQGAIPAICLNSQTSLLTALCNDGDPAMVFAQQVYGYGRAGDVLLAFSTSGNSANVANALRVARAVGCTGILIAGGTGGRCADLAEVAVLLPETETYKVQELTLPLYHCLCAMAEDAVFG